MANRYQQAQACIIGLLEPHDEDGLFNRLLNFTLLALILLNVIALSMETMAAYGQQYRTWFDAFERVSVSIFTAEYVLRLWACTSLPAYRHPLGGRLRFALTPLALIDLLAVLPFFLPLLLPIDLRFLRALRLFRMLRILKVVRYSDSLKTLAHVMKEKREDLTVTIFSAAILLMVMSSAVYFFENPAQPDKFPDIPTSLWWGVVTLTTVGYGDVFPITTIGRILGGIIAFLGIGMFALPAGILGSGFIEEMQRRRRSTGVCPQCGRPYAEQAGEESKILAGEGR